MKVEDLLAKPKLVPGVWGYCEFLRNKELRFTPTGPLPKPVALIFTVEIPQIYFPTSKFTILTATPR